MARADYRHWELTVESNETECKDVVGAIMRHDDSSEPRYPLRFVSCSIYMKLVSCERSEFVKQSIVSHSLTEHIDELILFARKTAYDSCYLHDQLHQSFIYSLFSN
jgi:hypothetical protein